MSRCAPAQQTQGAPLLCPPNLCHFTLSSPAASPAPWGLSGRAEPAVPAIRAERTCRQLAGPPSGPMALAVFSGLTWVSALCGEGAGAWGPGWWTESPPGTKETSGSWDRGQTSRKTAADSTFDPHTSDIGTPSPMLEGLRNLPGRGVWLQGELEVMRVTVRAGEGRGMLGDPCSRVPPTCTQEQAGTGMRSVVGVR